MEMQQSLAYILKHLVVPCRQIYIACILFYLICYDQYVQNNYCWNTGSWYSRIAL